MLVDERGRVVAAIEHLHAENPGSLEEETEERPLDNHLAENATSTLDREIDYTLGENSEAVLTAIDSALGRVDTGTYGVCERCRQGISEERLEAIPWTTLCIDCKRKEQR
jgi:RNA polymerase-binding protein DksA